jgi:hypothetical protein
VDWVTSKSWVDSKEGWFPEETLGPAYWLCDASYSVCGMMELKETWIASRAAAALLYDVEQITY